MTISAPEGRPLPQRRTTATVTTLPSARIARPRHYLMCRPTYFTVNYSINPWMDPEVPVDTALAMRQWESLRDVYRSLGHTVSFIEPIAGLPDMVFAANGGLVVDGKAMSARFAKPQRQPEGPAYEAWLRADESCVEFGSTTANNEGEGDFLTLGEVILAGTGFRTDRAAHAEAQEFLGKPVISLTLVNPSYYHLDTALTVLDEHHIAYYPGAFSPGSLAVLQGLFPDAVIATDADAEVFGLNSVSDGRNVMIQAEAHDMITALRRRGYNPVPVDMSEFRKSGGGPKCCTLELRP